MKIGIKEVKKKTAQKVPLTTRKSYYETNLFNCPSISNRSQISIFVQILVFDKGLWSKLSPSRFTSEFLLAKFVNKKVRTWISQQAVDYNLSNFATMLSKW